MSAGRHPGAVPDYLARYAAERHLPRRLAVLFALVVAGLLIAHDWLFGAGWLL